MDILKLLDELHDLTVVQPRSFGPLFWGINRDEISIQIAKVRASLPTELKQAVQTVRETERIVGAAKEDASMTLEGARKEAERILSEANLEAQRILDQTKIQQERMLSESEILRISKAQAEEIRNSADRDALHTRRGAENYAFEVLGQLEGIVGKVMTSIDKGKAEIRPDANSGAQPALRERIRV